MVFTVDVVLAIVEDATVGVTDVIDADVDDACEGSTQYPTGQLRGIFK